MKKLISTVLVLCFIFAFSSCKGKTGDSVQSTAQNEVAPTATESPSSDIYSSDAAPEDAQDVTATPVPIPGESYTVSDTGKIIKGLPDESADTFSGLAPLGKREFSFTEQAENLSRTTVSHAYGVAENETVHFISADFQKKFDESGLSLFCYDNITERKVLYLTFDCGYENGCTSSILDTLKKHGITAAFFCTLSQVKDYPELIARMINEGHIVGNHSVTHPDFSTLSSDEIISQVSGFDDYLRENFGYSASYFRYPQGNHSDYSDYVMNSLGYTCVFWSLAYVDWELDNQQGPAYALDTVISRIHPGAIMLLHSVSPDNAAALEDIITTAEDMGYEFVSLEQLPSLKKSNG